MLPSGLTSSLLLLQVVEQQAQLVAQLRGEHGFTPSIQRLSFRDDLLANIQDLDPPQGKPMLLCFQIILWSPCLGDGSRWLVLDPEESRIRLPIVLDLETGQQVFFFFFEEGPSPMRRFSGNYADLHAAWLTDKLSQLLFFLSWGEVAGSIAGLAHAHSQSLLPVIPAKPYKSKGHEPAGQEFSGDFLFSTICSTVLPWMCSSGSQA